MHDDKPSTNQARLSQLIFVDIQDKLVPVMDEADMTLALKNSAILAQAAKLLAVPMVCTEQYPKALGHTVLSLATHLAGVKTIEKTDFSCAAVPAFRNQLTQNHSQLILAGIEAHICILQTALGLLAMGKQVFIVEDAICSRQTSNKQNAIARLRDAGCIVTNTESVVFEWLGKAGGEHFKAISKLIR